MERMRLVTLFIIVSFIATTSLGTSSIVGYHEQVCEQGEKLALGFTIKNDHPFPMKDTIIKLNVTYCDGKPVSSMERMPYFLFSGSTIMSTDVGKIDEFHHFSTDIQTYPDTPLGDYTVNVNISFNDPNGIKMYEEHDLAFTLKRTPPPGTDGDKGGGIPGFEFAFLIVAIASMILLKRKNKRNQ